jgi:hypothetical protein
MDERFDEAARTIAEHRTMTIDEATAAVAAAMVVVPQFRAMLDRFAQDLAAWLAGLPRRDPFASRRAATVYARRSAALADQ